jgi:hypothetical protein
MIEFIIGLFAGFILEWLYEKYAAAKVKAKATAELNIIAKQLSKEEAAIAEEINKVEAAIKGQVNRVEEKVSEVVADVKNKL